MKEKKVMLLTANGGDKLSLDLPAAHIAMLKQLRKR
jgi:hypothetical protein